MGRDASSTITIGIVTTIDATTTVANGADRDGLIIGGRTGRHKAERGSRVRSTFGNHG
jgi:hypothetical protein